MSNAPESAGCQWSETDTAERRDSILDAMLKTPPKPYKDAGRATSKKRRTIFLPAVLAAQGRQQGHQRHAQIEQATPFPVLGIEPWKLRGALVVADDMHQQQPEPQARNDR